MFLRRMTLGLLPLFTLVLLPMAPAGATYASMGRLDLPNTVQGNSSQFAIGLRIVGGLIQMYTFWVARFGRKSSLTKMGSTGTAPRRTTCPPAGLRIIGHQRIFRTQATATVRGSTRTNLVA